MPANLAALPPASLPPAPRAETAAPSDALASDALVAGALVAGALDHLMRYALTGCDRSARHAAYLLERLAEQPGVCADLRGTCGRMSEALAAPDFAAAWRRSH